MAQHKCVYCKIHKKDVMLKGHGRCKFNNDRHFKGCKPCRQNFSKTLNAQRHREKKTNKSGVQKGRKSTENSVPSTCCHSEDISIPYDTNENAFENEEHICDSLNDINLEPFPSDSQMIGTSLNIVYNIEYPKPSIPIDFPRHVLIIMNENYPFRNLDSKYAEEFKHEIDNVIERLPGTSSDPLLRIQYKFYEKGYIKVACLDEETKNIVLNLARKFLQKYQRPKIIVIEESNLLTNIKMSCVIKDAPNLFADDDEFLREIQEKNKLDTTTWFIESAHLISESSNQKKFCFVVDLLSAGYISSRSFHLDIKGMSVQVFVRDKEELQRMYSTSLI